MITLSIMLYYIIHAHGLLCFPLVWLPQTTSMRSKAPTVCYIYPVKERCNQGSGNYLQHPSTSSDLLFGTIAATEVID